MSDPKTVTTPDCQCPKCGRLHKNLGAGKPPASISGASEYDLGIHSNPDAMAWVKFFRERNPDCNVTDDVMLGWFANSMMAMHDFLKGGGPINGDHAQHIVDEMGKLGATEVRDV
ncbi:MAG: hypothetical protein KGJ13_12545 [Patescibacteria group bacterium]|nr:hypothetical protein [Patescibacteria group bacterium]